MCGICGYAGFVEHGLLQRMTDSLRHRGPDDEGHYVTEDVALGVRRLAIIDVAGGKQPVSNEDGAVTVAYNGEIYNYVALREALLSRGHTFRTHGDAEVIVHAWEESGPRCLDLFHGMFAFALYDQRAGTLTLARDRVGMKPLYYTVRDGGLLFASEIKALLQSARVSRRPNPAAIDDYLRLRYAPNPETMFEGIHCLPAGHYLQWADGRATVVRWWSPPQRASAPMASGECVNAFDEVFTRAVKSHLMSEVPLGAYLSGGVDSSAIAAVMTRLGGRVKTFSLGFGSPVDETAQALELARHLGTDHTEIVCRPEDFDKLPAMVWHLERPIGDALILAYYVMAEQTSRSVKVVLAGEGADELFAGYSFHQVIAHLERVRGLPMGALAWGLRRAPIDWLDRFFTFPAYLGRHGRERVADFIAGHAARSLRGNYEWLRTLFAPAERQALYSREFLAEQAGRFPETAARGVRVSGAGGGNRRQGRDAFLDELLALQFDDWLQDFALLRQDKSTMAHSLELRLPFLDTDLVDLAFRMPADQKLKGLTTKVVERRWAERVLPRAVARRPKNPFYMPVEYFFEHPQVAGLIERTLNPDAVRRRGYFKPEAVTALVANMQTREFLAVKQVMALVILELWHQVFIDNLGP